MDHSTNRNWSKHTIPVRIQAALKELLEAWQYAVDTSGQIWDFAIEFERFLAQGVTKNDFRWLVHNGLVEHQCEITKESKHGRKFKHCGDLSFPDRTCFILTEKGLLLARELCGTVTQNDFGLSRWPDAVSSEGSNTQPLGSEPVETVEAAKHSHRPKWDADNRLLSFDGVQVKYFARKAPRQEKVLAAFEEEGWPRRIDDPLPPHKEQVTQTRLSDTIKSLNKNQINQILHFHGDGTGEGIIWDFIERK